MFATRLLRSACTSAGTLAPNATRPPVLWTHLPQELPYALGLLLQESLVAARLNAKKALLAQPDVSSTEASRLNRIANTDILLLLEHKPVFTAGRREKDPATAEAEAKRLGAIGADYVSTMRGGQTTYHGPGQLVGYSLMDLGAAELTTRCYVSHLETFLEKLTTALGVTVFPLDHTGVFTSPNLKIGSIGIHIRRRISLHGFSINIEQQTRKWFDAIVACGLDDVKSASVESEVGGEKKVKDVVSRAVELFGKQYGREMRELGEGDEWAELRRMIKDGVEGRLPPLKA